MPFAHFHIILIYNSPLSYLKIVCECSILSRFCLCRSPSLIFTITISNSISRTLTLSLSGTPSLNYYVTVSSLVRSQLVFCLLFITKIIYFIPFHFVNTQNSKYYLMTRIVFIPHIASFRIIFSSNKNNRVCNHGSAPCISGVHLIFFSSFQYLEVCVFLTAFISQQVFPPSISSALKTTRSPRHPDHLLLLLLVPRGEPTSVCRRRRKRLDIS